MAEEVAHSVWAMGRCLYEMLIIKNSGGVAVLWVEAVVFAHYQAQCRTGPERICKDMDTTRHDLTRPDTSFVRFPATLQTHQAVKNLLTDIQSIMFSLD